MKRIVSLLLTLIIAMSLIPSAYAEESGSALEIRYITSTTTDDGYYSKVGVRNLTSDIQTGVLVVAYYSPNGDFLDFAYTDISLSPNEFPTCSVKFDSKPTLFQKAFIWDGFGTFKPLAEAYSSSSVKYAIAISLGKTEEQIKLLLSDGGVRTYAVDTTQATNFTADFVTDNISDKTSVTDRAVAYTLSPSTGKITNICKIEPSISFLDAEFNPRTLTLGNTILDTTMPIIQIYEDCEGTSKAGSVGSYDWLTPCDFTTGTEYTGHVYKFNADVSLVVITKILTKYEEASRFAVAVDIEDALSEEGEEIKLVTALYNGTFFELQCAPTAVADLKPQDTFFFETGSDEIVDKIYKPVPGDPVWEKKIDTDEWSYNVWYEQKPIQFFTGVVTKVTSIGVSFATIEQVQSGSLNTNLDLNSTHSDGIVTFELPGYCDAYVYDSTKSVPAMHDSERYDAISVSSIKASNFTAYDSGNGILNDGIFSSSNLMSKATIATAMVYDGELMEIFAIEPK